MFRILRREVVFLGHCPSSWTNSLCLFLFLFFIFSLKAPFLATRLCKWSLRL